MGICLVLLVFKLIIVTVSKGNFSTPTMVYSTKLSLDAGITVCSMFDREDCRNRNPSHE